MSVNLNFVFLMNVNLSFIIIKITKYMLLSSDLQIFIANGNDLLYIPLNQNIQSV